MLLPPVTTPKTERMQLQMMQTTKEWKWLAPDKNVRFSNGLMVIADSGTVEYEPLEIYSQVVSDNEVSVLLPQTLEPVGSYFRIGVRSQAFDALFRTFKVVLPVPVSENPELLHVTFLTPAQQWNAGVPGSMARRFGRPYANADTLYGDGTLFVLTRNKNLPKLPVTRILPGQLPGENREIGVLRPQGAHSFRNGSRVYASDGVFTGTPLVVYSEIVSADEIPEFFGNREPVGNFFRIGAYDDTIGTGQRSFEFTLPTPKNEDVCRLEIAVLYSDDPFDPTALSSWLRAGNWCERLLEGRQRIGLSDMHRKGAVFVLIRSNTPFTFPPTK